MYLLKIELKKLFTYITFWALMGICFISTFFLALVAKDISSKLNSNIPSINTVSWYQFPNVWENLTWLCSYINLFFISIIIITLVCNEYTFRTIRQNAIDGLSRFEIVIGKIGLIIGLSLFMTLITGLMCLLFGFIYANDNINFFTMFDKIAYLGDFFIQAIAYGTVAFAIATLFKRTGISIVLFFVYKIIIESILDWFVFKESSGDYLPMNLFSALTPNPITQMAVKAKIHGIEAYSISSPAIECLALVYILIIFGLTYLLIKNRDL